MNCAHCGFLNDRNYLACRKCGRTRVIGPPGASGGGSAATTTTTAGPRGPTRADPVPRRRSVIPDVIAPPGYVDPPPRVDPPARIEVPAVIEPPAARPPESRRAPAEAGTGARDAALSGTRASAGATADRGWARQHRGALIGTVLTVLGGILAVLQPVMGITFGKSGGDTYNVIPAGAAPAPVPVAPPGGGSDIDKCLLGRWSATGYRRIFTVDDVDVTIALISGAGFSLNLNGDGTGSESRHTNPRLRGTANGYTVEMWESGRVDFRFGEHDGVLTFDGVQGVYDYQLFVNDREVPEDQVEWIDVYTVKYDCSGGRLVLSTDFSRIEYARV